MFLLTLYHTSALHTNVPNIKQINPEQILIRHVVFKTNFPTFVQNTNLTTPNLSTCCPPPQIAPNASRSTTDEHALTD